MMELCMPELYLPIRLYLFAKTDRKKIETTATGRQHESK
jgi:hypothetical protein